MNQSSTRKSILKNLKFAISVIELAKEKDITDSELLETVEIIKLIHQEKTTAATVVEKKCIYCGKSAELQNANDSWICEDCAQSISSHATDMGY